jgi:hypothetical protein
MGTALKINENETTLLRAHYEGVARDTLRIIRDRKLLVAAILVAALVVASIALVLVGPRYRGEAIILMIRRAGFLGFSQRRTRFARLPAAASGPPGGAHRGNRPMASSREVLRFMIWFVRQAQTNQITAARAGSPKNRDYRRAPRGTLTGVAMMCFR